MPLLIFLLIVILIAQVGFWDTLSAILGGVLVLVLFLAVLALLVVLAGRYAWDRMSGRTR